MLVSKTLQFCQHYCAQNQCLIIIYPIEYQCHYSHNCPILVVEPVHHDDWLVHACEQQQNCQYYNTY